MARRSNGEGTIYRRKDGGGRWEGAIYVVTASGIRKRQRVYGNTQAEVRRNLTDLKAKRDQGVPIANHKWRVDLYLDYWLDQAVRTKRRALTYRRHEAVTRRHLKPGLGRYVLDQLSVLVVQHFIDQLIAQGHSPATVHQIRKVLSAALTYAVRLELLHRNPARLVELPSYRPKEAAHWDSDDAEQFLQAARTNPLYPLFVLLVLYGLRSGEIRGLRWCDVDLTAEVLRIRQQVQRIGGSLQQVALKTSTSWRDEPLLATARSALEQQRRLQSAYRDEAGATWQGASEDTELVFTTKTGRPLEAQNLSRSFHRICTAHGLKRITLHGLRHTNATTQKSLQVHDRDIQAILGHGDVRTTGIYQHVDMASKRSALEKVEHRLFESTADDDGSDCRQHQPSSLDIVARLTSFFFGGSSQTRTGDTRLFSSFGATWTQRATVVRTTVNARATRWLLGTAAVSLAVKKMTL
jgi:integrase